MKILQLSVHFSPNVGGVETHLSDLVKELVNKRNNVFVITYRPLTAKTKWQIFEKEKNLTILRLPWLPGFFYSLVQNPVLEFIYLVPGLLLVLPIVLLFYDPDVVHTHGLVAGFVGVFWGKFFGKRVITTTHSIYHFPKKGLYNRFARIIFTRSDKVLTLSKLSKKEIIKLGIDEKKIDVFTYWVDLNKFRPMSKKQKAISRKKLGWSGKFVVLFVGRLVPEKGLNELLEAVKLTKDKKIVYAIAGSGPMEVEIKKQEAKSKNLEYLGRVEQAELSKYYSAADVVIVPSTHEEGFGRVILESLACGTPVIAAKRGAIPEAMDESVGKLIDITAKNIKDCVNYYYKHKINLRTLSNTTRGFAVRRYSIKNTNKIVESYN